MKLASGEDLPFSLVLRGVAQQSSTAMVRNRDSAWRRHRV